MQTSGEPSLLELSREQPEITSVASNLKKEKLKNHAKRINLKQTKYETNLFIL